MKTKKLNKYLLLSLLFVTIVSNFSFKTIENKRNNYQRDGYYFFLTAQEHIPSTGKFKIYISEVMYFKGYDDCNRNLDYQYYGIVSQKFKKYLADKYKVEAITLGRKGGKKGEVGYIATKEIGLTRLNKYLKFQADLRNEAIRTDFNYNCSDLK